jgi:hypothetical protein
MTRVGWAVLDSNSSWIGFDERQSCISLSKFQRTLPSERRVADADPVLATNFIFVYGLYARHGYFYWPYNGVPDINVFQFLQGLPVLFMQLWSCWKPKKHVNYGLIETRSPPETGRRNAGGCKGR